VHVCIRVYMCVFCVNSILGLGVSPVQALYLLPPFLCVSVLVVLVLSMVPGNLQRHYQ
jgi:hypothetical protein